MEELREGAGKLFKGEQEQARNTQLRGLREMNQAHDDL